jgi:hypothetical protein
MTLRKIRELAGLLGLVWLFGMIVTYYVGHKPFTPAVALNLVQSLWQLCVAIGIVMVGGGLGARLLPWLDFSVVVRAVLQAAFGLGVLSIGLLLLGWIIGLQTSLIAGILLLLLVALRHEIKNWLITWRGLSKYWISGDCLAFLISLGIGLILLFTLVAALAPPVKFDALVYHLALPSLYLHEGKIGYVYENMFWGMPQTTEMLYTWSMALAGSQGATLLGWLFGTLTLTGLLGFADHYFGGHSAWIALGSLLAGSTVSASLAWGYVDWLVMLFALAFFVSLEKWIEIRDQRYLLLAGAFAGMAVGTKYPAGLLFLAGLAVLLFQLTRHQRRWSTVISFSLAAGLFALPWSMKNLLPTGNPLYPFLFPSGAMDSLRISLYQSKPNWVSWKDVVFLPFRASFWGYEGGPGYGATIGPLLLGLGSLAWIDWRGRSPQIQSLNRTAAIIAGIGLIIWGVVSRLSTLLIQSRLYFSIFPIVAVLCSAGYHVLQEKKFLDIRIGRITGALVLLVLWLSVFEIGVSTLATGAPQELLALNSDEQYLSDNLGWYYPAMQRIRALPSDAQVLMLWEPRSFYCLPECLPDEVLDRWIHDLRTYGEPDLVLKSWEERGYTHVLYYRLGAEFVREEDKRYKPSEWQALDLLLSRLTAVDDIGGVYELYSIQR